MMIDIIIPVYKGFEDTKQCLESLRSCLDGHNAHAVVINDASPDPSIEAYLESVAQKDSRITLLKNPENFGFIKTVNRGMALHPDRNLILLNADTVVAGDWVERLHACAQRDPKTGTVTPFSNNATILSFPRSLKENPLVDGFSVEEIDKIFKSVNTGMEIDIPTAVGFCMYIKRACLDEAGFFDELHFGIGYGEENDFCMRAAQKGWRHRLCADTFVYHKGGVSFDAVKNQRIEKALSVLGQLHPDYHRLVREHIAADPERPFRINAMLHLVRRSKKRKVLHITHNLGGGTETHIRDLTLLLKERLWPILLFPSENGALILQTGLEKGSDALAFTLPWDYDKLLSVLRFLHVERVHIHQILGLHESALAIPTGLAIPYDITLHDHYLINGNPTLIDKNARFCDDRETRDDHCQEAYPVPGGVPAHTWREKQATLLEGADRVFSPSAFTAAIFTDYFPDIQPVVAFHPEWEREAPYPTPEVTEIAPGLPFRILVLGAMSREKGADTLEACSRIAAKEGHPLQFHLAGYAYRRLHPSVIQHGAYEEKDLPGIIHAIDPHLIWFPATWPETYSYTLSAALKAARPIAAPNIGAFPERLKNRPLTWIVAWRSDPATWIEQILSIRSMILENIVSGKSISSWNSQPSAPAPGFRYLTHYLASGGLTPVSGGPEISLDLIQAHLSRPEPLGGKGGPLPIRAKILLFLLKLRNHPATGWLINRIPYRLQQAVKRKIAPVGDPLSSVVVSEQIKYSMKK